MSCFLHLCWQTYVQCNPVRLAVQIECRNFRRQFSSTNCADGGCDIRSYLVVGSCCSSAFLTSTFFSLSFVDMSGLKKKHFMCHLIKMTYENDRLIYVILVYVFFFLSRILSAVDQVATQISSRSSGCQSKPLAFFRLPLKPVAVHRVATFIDFQFKSFPWIGFSSTVYFTQLSFKLCTTDFSVMHTSPVCHLTCTPFEQRSETDILKW